MTLKKLFLTIICILPLLPLITSMELRGSQRNCLCQCIPLQYIDGRGILHGNCESTNDGALWCYVKYQKSSPCGDLVKSDIFQDRYWSYHACTTPVEDSSICKDTVIPLFFLGAYGGSRRDSQPKDVP
nr:uncharacterized protein LOC121120937 [Lepeophtheirus salmonis]